MDQPTQYEKPEPVNSEEEGLATRRIDPSEGYLAPELVPQALKDAPTVSIARDEDSAETKLISPIQEEVPSPPKVTEPPEPIISSAQPAAFSSTARPEKDNRIPIIAIISVAVVSLFCICACTAIIITALMMIPTY